MKVLVFGKSGQVGFELMRQLLDQGFEVLGFDSNEADFLKPCCVLDLVSKHKPHVVINAVAYTKVDKAESPEAQESVMQINAVTPGLLGELCKELDILLVHYSTDYVFDGQFTKPIVEVEITNPLNVYGHSKLEGERRIQQSGCKHLILRISWVYASRGQNFYLTMRQLFSEKTSLNIVNDQIGAPTSAIWVAQITTAVLMQKDLNIKLGLYHLSPNGEISWFGFAKAILQKLKQKNHFVAIKVINPILTSEYPTPARRPLYSKMDSSKFVSTFGIQLPTWEELLEQI